MPDLQGDSHDHNFGLSERFRLLRQGCPASTMSLMTTCLGAVADEDYDAVAGTLWSFCKDWCSVV